MDLESRGIIYYYTIRVAKTKALISFAADLRLCFHLCRLLVFPCNGSIIKTAMKAITIATKCHRKYMYFYF